MPDNLLETDPGTFGSSGEPVVTPKDHENKDGMLAKPSGCLPPGAAKGGEKVYGGRLGS